MTEQDYITERVDGQIAWYNRKAGTNKTYHYWCKTIIMTFSAAIPVITLIHYDINLKDITLGTLGAIIAILTGMSALMSYQEKWTEYRESAEELLHEKMMFLTRTGLYSNHGFDHFVARIEDILKGERSKWSLNAKKSI